MKFLAVRYNARANGIEFKAFDDTLTHWVTNQGDDIVVNHSLSTILVKVGNKRRIKKLRVVRHTPPYSTYLTKEDLGVGAGDLAKPANTDASISNRKVNPIIYKGIKLNRAQVVALFFVPNEEGYPFVSVKDGDETNLHADNLYWTDRNIFPNLNIKFEAEELRDAVVIQSPALRVCKENLSLYGWEKSYTKFTVPIPNDVLGFLNQWKISVHSAVFTSLKFLSQWSFCVYAIEYEDAGRVFVGMTPALDGIYIDQIYKVASEIPYLNEVILREGHAVLKLKYLNLSQKRTEAYDSCVRFMNEYFDKGWHVINSDFYHPDMERQVILSLSHSDLEDLNAYLHHKKGIDLKTYLRATISKLKRDFSKE